MPTPCPAADQRVVDHQIVVTNTTTGQTLLDTTSYYDAAVDGGITAGSAAARSLSNLPNGVVESAICK